MTTKRILIPSVALLILGIATALTLSLSGFVSAQSDGSNDEPETATLTVKPIPASVWNRLRPKPASAAGSWARAPYTNADVTSTEGGAWLSWTFPDYSDVASYRIERRIIEPDDIPVDWELLEAEYSKTSLEYYDMKSAPLFRYEYRITKNLANGDLGDDVSFEANVYQREGLFGYGTATGVQLHVATNYTDRLVRHRITRYTGRADTGGVVLTGSPTHLSALADAVSKGYYRYELEYVKYDADEEEWVVQTGLQYEPNAIVVWAQPDEMTAPSVLEVRQSTTGGVDIISWSAPSSGKGSYALYEVLRRDTLEYGSEYAIIRTSYDQRTVDNTAEDGKHYEYAVRAADFNHNHSDLSPSVISPALVRPTCTPAASSETEENINEIAFLYPEQGPDNDSFAIQAWMIYRVDPTHMKSCKDVNPAEWTMTSRLVYHHGIGDACDPAEQSCDLVDVRTPASPSDMSQSAGYWKQVDSETIVWYDDISETADGLYLYEYRVCSRATDSTGTPYVCSGDVRGPWRFVGVDSIPFAKTD